MTDLRDRYRGTLLGLAAGDAVGTTVEFQPRGAFSPVEDMVGGGPFDLQPGQWTDDTSMALCLAASLVERGEFAPRDQMDRYCAWMQHGYMSSTGTCFDIGATTSRALHQYLQTGDPYSGSTDAYMAGNGSIMRLTPVVMFFYPDYQAAVDYAARSSRTTHGADEAIAACRLLALYLCRALAGEEKDDILFTPAREVAPGALPPKIADIAQGAYKDKSREVISGSGYVVNSLEAALWSFYHTETFEDAILTAVNLGDDADTTAAVCGQIAGAAYGASAIPGHWLDILALRAEIEALIEKLLPAPI